MRRLLLLSYIALAACASGVPGVSPVAPTRDSSTSAAPAPMPTQPWPAAWTTFRFSNQHTGLSNFTSSFRLGPFKPRWTYRAAGGTGTSLAAGAGGLIYFGSSDAAGNGGFLYCLNSNGTLRWKRQTDRPLTTGVTIGNNGMLYVGGLTYVYAFDSKGARQWMFRTKRPVVASPTLSTGGSTLYVSSFDHHLYALNAQTGKLIWTFTAGDGIDATPMVGPDQTIYVGTYDGFFYAIDPTNGSTIWQYYMDFLVESTAAIDKQGEILVGSDIGVVWSLIPTPGIPTPQRVLGLVPVGSPIYSSVAIGPDGTFYGLPYHTFYVAAWSGTLTKFAYGYVPSSAVPYLKMSTPIPLWSFSTTLPFFSSPAVSADDHVFIGGSDANFYEFDGNTGHLLARFPTAGPIDSEPAIGYDGTVYIGTSNGYVYAFH